MLAVEGYGRVRRASRDGMSIRAIARRPHHSRRKVRKILANPEPRPHYTRNKDRPAPKPHAERGRSGSYREAEACSSCHAGCLPPTLWWLDAVRGSAFGCREWTCVGR